MIKIDGQSLSHASVEEFPTVGELLAVVDICSLRHFFRCAILKLSGIHPHEEQILTQNQLY
ncbi:hypothetical protein T01_10230 [Trichinella spiralis]|uniref:Uncharacterized protein n=1 Tax=Trichinella spiralis TaxID=6334 RepID=A0A0V1B1I2_TRISP|nr:hypothetical protein T01_10230 [Trichinella spiralis]